ncbi:MAG: 50S ribosomal protein L18 [Planctomycetota bacterium]|jgi:large subunit ribosomal protein L18
MATQKRLLRRRQRRAFGVRKRVRGTAERPRLSIHRTHHHMYAQVIDDEAGRTLCEASSVSLEIKPGGGVEAARKVGEALGKKAADLEIVRIGFDRGPYKYHGRVKALADAVREAGLKF